jgi:hypothetical protein
MRKVWYVEHGKKRKSTRKSTTRSITIMITTLFAAPVRQRFTVHGVGTLQRRRIVVSVLHESLSNSNQAQILECESRVIFVEND